MYVIYGQNVMAERWPGTSPDDPTHLCGVTGSPTASLCVPLSSNETRWWWLCVCVCVGGGVGSKHSSVFCMPALCIKQKIHQPSRRSSDGVLRTSALNGPLIKSKNLDELALLSA